MRIAGRSSIAVELVLLEYSLDVFAGAYVHKVLLVDAVPSNVQIFEVLSHELRQVVTLLGEQRSAHKQTARSPVVESRPCDALQTITVLITIGARRDSRSTFAFAGVVVVSVRRRTERSAVAAISGGP